MTERKNQTENNSNKQFTIEKINSSWAEMQATGEGGKKRKLIKTRIWYLKQLLPRVPTCSTTSPIIESLKFVYFCSNERGVRREIGGRWKRGGGKKKVQEKFNELFGENSLPSNVPFIRAGFRKKMQRFTPLPPLPLLFFYLPPLQPRTLSARNEAN